MRCAECTCESGDDECKWFGSAAETRGAVDVLIESLQGADRVVVETKNALGEYDAHYLHAPSLLLDLEELKGAM